MMRIVESLKSDGLLMGGLEFGVDLLEALTQACVENSIDLGRVEAIGAVQRGRIGYYDQQSREYVFKDLDKPMEIANLTGNISLKDGEPFVHAHVTLVDEDGICHGGHLAEGNIVFACEFLIEKLSGARFERGYDKTTGLTLW